MVYKYGFILARDFYPNSGTGHEKNAQEIIRKKNWGKAYDNYYARTHGSYQDFLVMEKGAIQLGSSGHCYIIYSIFKVSEHDIDNVVMEYNLIGYKRIRYSR